MVLEGANDILEPEEVARDYHRRCHLYFTGGQVNPKVNNNLFGESLSAWHGMLIGEGVSGVYLGNDVGYGSGQDMGGWVR